MNRTILPLNTFLTYSLGCRTNQAEIEMLGQQLMNYGLKQAVHRNPDIVLLNTCVVTSKAERETRKEIRKLRKLNPKSYIVVLGCAIDARNKLQIKIPEADLFISNQEKKDTLKIIEQKFSSLLKAKISPNIMNNKYVQSGRKFVKIQDGCNNTCSFCITTLLRGQSKSVSKEKIIDEINYWISKGVKEVILTGINISLYGIDIKTDILSLLETILSKTKIERISFSSIYPEMLTKDFLDLIIDNLRVTRCFHLSLQSCSPTVLKRMNRETDLHRLLSRLTRIKSEIPHFTFRADLIAGFPDETEEEFQETLNLIETLKISFAHVFPFSKRKGTLAYKMKDLPHKIKTDRAKIITQTVEKIRKNEAIKQLSQTSMCLIVRKIDRHSRESGKLYNYLDRFRLKAGMTIWEGITETGWPISVQVQRCKAFDPSSGRGCAKVQSLRGKILPVKIVEFINDHLVGVTLDV